ncbi:MAG: hypothetical protein FGM55_05375 [Rhodoferax sp.]|nr:hypothetical protein [Rhodoferax sp.]
MKHHPHSLPSSVARADPMATPGAGMAQPVDAFADREVARTGPATISRRRALMAMASAGWAAWADPAAASSTGEEFNLWAFGDAHVGRDLLEGRESLAEALRQSELGAAAAFAARSPDTLERARSINVGGNSSSQLSTAERSVVEASARKRDDPARYTGPSFNWDIAINVGDNSAAEKPPADPEGEEIVRQYGALTRHKREDIYDLSGNHDRGGCKGSSSEWFEKWVDPMGTHTATSGVDHRRRPYPVNGTWERYSFRVGNILFLMMSDVVEPTQPCGRDQMGGNPGGVVRGDTFAWFKKMELANERTSIIVAAHHYVLRNTTVASGPFEGFEEDDRGNMKPKYHGLKPRGAPEGTSYLYWVNSVRNSTVFEKFLAQRPGRVALWLGGHTHTDPDDRTGGKSHIETRWGTHFINVSALTRFHGPLSRPMSRLISFANGSDQLRVRCYLHTDQHAAQGWYPPAERVLQLPRAFRR